MVDRNVQHRRRPKLLAFVPQRVVGVAGQDDEVKIPSTLTNESEDFDPLPSGREMWSL